MHRALAPIAAVSVLALTGCGGVEPDDHYDTAEDLRAALESEDYRCTEDRTESAAEGYAEELYCEEGMWIAVWEEDLPDYVDDPSMAFLMGGQVTDAHHLVSDTWAVTSDNADLIADMQEAFGGQAISPNEDVQDTMEEYG